MQSNLELFQENVNNIKFNIPNNTSTSYYLKVIKKMLEQDAKTTWDSRTIVVEDETGTIEKDIIRIELFFGSRIGKVGLLFRIKTRRSDNGIEMDNTIETVSVKPGILSEREELSFLYNDQIYRYNYLREYDDDGICIFHNNRDLVKKTSTSARLYTTGLLLSKFDNETNTGRSVIMVKHYTKEEKKELSSEIKKGKIFSLIDSEDAIEIPYKPYPLSEAEFDDLIAKL